MTWEWFLVGLVLGHLTARFFRRRTHEMLDKIFNRREVSKVEPQAGDQLFTEDGDELRIEEVTGVDNDKRVFIVRAEDGLRYEVSWDGDGWLGNIYPEDL